MTTDNTEQIRREMISTEGSHDRSALESEHGQVWSTDEVRSEFEVVGFMAPFVVVVRRSDSVKGSLQFQGSPRFYYGFKAD